MTTPPLLSGSRFLVGHLPDMRNDLMGTLLRARAEMGGMCTVQVAYKRIWWLFEPEHVEHVMVRRRENYEKRTRGYHVLRLVLGHGLLTADGEFWLKQRRTMQPEFRRPRVADLCATMVDVIERELERWRPIAAAGGTVDVAHRMNRMALAIAGETLFSRDISTSGDEVGEALDVVLDDFYRLTLSPLPNPSRWPTAHNRRFHQAVAQLQRLVDGMVAERRRTGELPDDLLTRLLEARDPETGEAMDDVQIRDEALTMLLAGHETTANALAWTLDLLSRHPDIEEQHHADALAILGSGIPTAEQAAKLEQSRRVFAEGMRLYPPVWFMGRTAVEDDEIGGHRVAKGTDLFMAPYVMHRMPEYWREPERFDPERFSPERSADRPRYLYWPFSIGARKCIGEHFARLEAILALAMIAREFRLEALGEAPPAMDPSVTLRPRNSIDLRLHRR